MDHVKCPHCGKKVELSEAIIHELQEQVRAEEEKKLKAEFEEQKAKEQAEREKKLREEFEEENKKNSEFLEKAKKEKLELEEKLKKEQEDREKAEEKAREQARKTAEEEQRLKLKEKDLQVDQIKKVAEDLRRANEELKRKLEQGSQQMQGEVLELDLEQKLKAAFPADEFVPIPKGVEGGDIWQKVKFNGKTVGSIIWETKRTKAWSKLWLTKLKDDAGKISASEAIIVSQVLPNGSENFDRIDGVWITTYEHAMNICRYVRFLVTTVATIKSSASHTEEEWGQIRDYMMSDSFKHRMQAHFDSVNALRQNLDSEKRATILRWKKQETLIEKLDTNSTNFYGELQSIVPSLPEIKGVDNLITDGEENPLF